MATNELTITNISASGLGQSSPDEDVSKHNPYVVFQVGNQEHKTKGIRKAGTEVSWEGETISLHTGSGDILTVSAKIQPAHFGLSTLSGMQGTRTWFSVCLRPTSPVRVPLDLHFVQNTSQQLHSNLSAGCSCLLTLAG